MLENRLTPIALLFMEHCAMPEVASFHLFELTSRRLRRGSLVAGSALLLWLELLE